MAGKHELLEDPAIEDQQVREDPAEGLVGRAGQQGTAIGEGREKERLSQGIVGPLGSGRALGAFQVPGAAVHDVQGIEEVEVPHVQGVQHFFQRVELGQLLAVLIFGKLALANAGLPSDARLAVSAQLAQEAERLAQIGKHGHARNVSASRHACKHN
jgi:hypothetical protein